MKNPLSSTFLTRKSVRYSAAFVATAIAAGVLAACGGGGDQYATVQTPVNPVAQMPETKALYAVNFVNAANNGTIADPLTVTVQANTTLVDSAGKILNGQPISVTTGQLSFGSNTSGPVEVLVQAENTQLGWIKNSIKLNGESNTNESKMLKLVKNDANTAAAMNANKSIGITMEVVTVKDMATGASISTPNKEVTSNISAIPAQTGSTTLAIKPGTKAIDPVSKQPIAINGDIKISATKFANTDSQSMAAFPGGFTISAAEASTAGTEVNTPQNFLTGGFAQFSVTDATGKKLTTFDKPLEVSIDLYKGAKDPQGKLLKPGDIYPVWSYNNDTGKWTFEKNGVVAEKNPVDPKFFKVNFETTHLSWWNLDFHSAPCPGDGTGALTFNRQDNRPLFLDIRVSGSVPEFGGWGTLFWSNEANYVTDSYLNLRNVPRYPVDIDVYDTSDNWKIIKQAKSVNLCDKKAVIDLPAPVQIPQSTIKVEAFESCADGSNKRNINGWFVVNRFVDLYGGYYAHESIDKVNNGSFTATRKITSKTKYIFSFDGGSYIDSEGKSLYFSPRQSLELSSGDDKTITFSRTMQCKGVTGGSSAS